MVKYCQVIRVIAHTQVGFFFFYKGLNDDTRPLKRSLGENNADIPLFAAFRLINPFNKVEKKF